MPNQYLHAWDVSVEEAAEIQKRLQPLVQTTNSFEPDQIKTVAGIDCSLKDEGLAAIVVLSYPDLQLVDQVTFTSKITFPYVPGYLSFREMPVIMQAVEHLQVWPDLVMVDGQGLAHPRRFGIACHAGLFLDLPTIGCAKSVLTGHYGDLGLEAGDETALLDRHQVIGTALRSKKNTNPLIISVGHKIDLTTAVAFVKSCLRGYRLPETTRLADKLSRSPEPLPQPNPLKPSIVEQGHLF